MLYIQLYTVRWDKLAKVENTIRRGKLKKMGENDDLKKKKKDEFKKNIFFNFGKFSAIPPPAI